MLENGHLLIYRFRGLKVLTGERQSLDTSSTKRRKCNDDTALKEAKEEGLKLHERVRRVNSSSLIALPNQPKMDSGTINNIVTTMPQKPVLDTQIARDFMERKRTEQYDLERHALDVAQCETWLDELKEKKRRSKNTKNTHRVTSCSRSARVNIPWRRWWRLNSSR